MADLPGLRIVARQPVQPELRTARLAEQSLEPGSRDEERGAILSGARERGDQLVR